MWKFVCPGTSWSDDLMINPVKDPDLAGAVLWEGAGDVHASAG